MTTSSCLRSLVQFLALALLASPFGRAVEMRPPNAVLEKELGPGLKHVGDFALLDSKANVFAVGRILVDFSSIYAVLAKSPEAGGECEFMHIEYKNGEKTRAAVHRLRYAIQFGKSTIQLNTDVPGTELALEFEFDPTKEFAEGVIRRGLAADSEVAGTCRIRIKDPAK